MHHVGRVDWSFADSPQPASRTASGLARQVLVGRAQGAVHSEVAVAAFAPGGWLGPHVHAYEEAFYVLAGEVALELEGRFHRLAAGDYAVLPVGHRHATANAGEGQARWLTVNSPQRQAAGSERRDTWFAAGPFDPAAFVARASRPPFGDPTLRLVGHDDGAGPVAVPPEPGRTRLTTLADGAFGADMLGMLAVDYGPRGAAGAHDHPYEVTFLVLGGRFEVELEGRPYMLAAGDAAFAGVGAAHRFANPGDAPARFIEVQMPQPPRRHATRSLEAWRRLDAEAPA